MRIDKIYWGVIRFISWPSTSNIRWGWNVSQVKTTWLSYGWYRIVSGCIEPICAEWEKRQGWVYHCNSQLILCLTQSQTRTEMSCPLFQPSCYNLALFSSLSFFLHLKEKTKSTKKTQMYTLESSFCILNGWFMFCFLLLGAGKRKWVGNRDGCLLCSNDNNEAPLF